MSNDVSICVLCRTVHDRLRQRQDEENGWQLRVSPEREASEERQDWARYAGDSDGRHPGDDLYYNARTGEGKRKFNLWISYCSLDPLINLLVDVITSIFAVISPTERLPDQGTSGSMEPG